MIDQIYQELDPVICNFMVQKEPKTISEVKKFPRMGQSFEKEEPSVELNRLQYSRLREQQTGECQLQFNNGRSRYQNKRCHICDRKSHIARDCLFRKDRL